MTIPRRILLLYTLLAVATAIATVIFFKHKQSVEIADYAYSREQMQTPTTSINDCDDDKSSLSVKLYECKPVLKRVMRQLAENGPNDYYYDKKIDCKDWSISFMELWYKQDVPDGSCILVRNLNKFTDFDHLMVAVYCNSAWLVIEPQACKKEEKYWDPQMWWGKWVYSPSFDLFGQSWLYLHSADRSIGDLMSRSCSTQEEFEWSLQNELRR